MIYYIYYIIYIILYIIYIYYIILYYIIYIYYIRLYYILYIFIILDYIIYYIYIYIYIFIILDYIYYVYIYVHLHLTMPLFSKDPKFWSQNSVLDLGISFGNKDDHISSRTGHCSPNFIRISSFYPWSANKVTHPHLPRCHQEETVLVSGCAKLHLELLWKRLWIRATPNKIMVFRLGVYWVTK